MTMPTATGSTGTASTGTGSPGTGQTGTGQTGTGRTGTGPTARAVRRVVAGVAVTLVLLVPLSVVFGLLWSRSSGDVGSDRQERLGVQYLRPLAELTALLAQQQSAAVSGNRIDTTAMRQAIAAVDAVDGPLGGTLRTTERWTQLRRQVIDVIRRRLTGVTAFTTYSGVVDLMLALDRKIGDSSRLVLDPAVDSYYVMNAALLRLPQILRDTGRYADLAVIIARTGGQPQANLPELAAARNNIATAAADLNDGLQTAFTSSSSASLGPGLLRQLDDFRSAVDAIAPSTSLLTPLPSAADLANGLSSSKDVVVRQSLALERAALDQLDLLLSTRIGAADRQRAGAIAALAGGVLLAVAAGIWLRPVRPAGRRGRPPRPAARHASRDDEPPGVLIGIGPGAPDVSAAGSALPAGRGGGRAAQ